MDVKKAVPSGIGNSPFHDIPFRLGLTCFIALHFRAGPFGVATNSGLTFLANHSSVSMVPVRRPRSHDPWDDLNAGRRVRSIPTRERDASGVRTTRIVSESRRSSTFSPKCQVTGYQTTNGLPLGNFSIIFP